MGTGADHKELGTILKLSLGMAVMSQSMNRASLFEKSLSPFQTASWSDECPVSVLFPKFALIPSRAQLKSRHGNLPVKDAHNLDVYHEHYANISFS